MKIHLIVSSFNSLSQAIYCKLKHLGHEVFIDYSISSEYLLSSIEKTKPDLIFCPYLKEYLEKDIYENYETFILHPGIRGDRGHQSLDYVIKDEVKQWGVTILRAHEHLDLGDIYAEVNFEVKSKSKSLLYSNEVTQASLKALDIFLDNIKNNSFKALPQINNPIKNLIKTANRAINWIEDSTNEIIKKINMSDSNPGVLDELFSIPCYLYGACLENELRGEIKEVLAKRDGAICIGTKDGAFWISHIKIKGSFKLPATYALKDKLTGVKENRIPLVVEYKLQSYHELSYEKDGELIYLHFDFYNGAISSSQAIRLKYAIQYLQEQCKVLVLMGGENFFCNGIHLNIVEDSKKQAEDAWSNINAMNEVVKEILLCEDTITVAYLNKNAGAGGVFLALACDKVISTQNCILNPHYKTLGLTGSEYHTFTLPNKVGAKKAQELLNKCIPINAFEAKKINLVDEVISSCEDKSYLKKYIDTFIEDEEKFEDFLDGKKDFLFKNEKIMHSCKEQELKIMHDEFYLKESSFHTLRANFVHKKRLYETPKRLKEINNA